MSLLLQELPPRVLLHLAKKEEPIGISDLSLEMGIAQSQVSEIITKLSQGGIVSSDWVGHKKFVQLTERGEKAAVLVVDLLKVVSA